MDADEDVAGHEERMETHARRQTKALETSVLLQQVWLFLVVLVGVLWLIAVLGS